jgi:hypothetical protein
MTPHKAEGTGNQAASTRTRVEEEEETDHVDVATTYHTDDEDDEVEEGNERLNDATRRRLSFIARALWQDPAKYLPERLPHMCAPPTTPQPPRPQGRGTRRATCQINQRFHGRLRDHAQRWADIGASPEVMKVVQSGFSIEFGPAKTACDTVGCQARACDEGWMCPKHKEGSPPTRASVTPSPTRGKVKNHTGARDHARWLRAAVAELVLHGSAIECDEPPRCALPLNVEPKATAGKFRLCHDLRAINLTVKRRPFKMETLQAMRGSFRKGRWIASLDMSSSYYHVDMAADSTQFLGFCLDGRYYKFVSLPFGLSSAPAVFTDLVMTLVRHWRGEDGFEVVSYLDDQAAIGDSYEQVQGQINKMLHDMEDLGFVINREKSQLEPVRCDKFLGIDLCFQDGVFRVPQTRLASLEAAIVHAASSGTATPRQIYSIAGKIGSMTMARGRKACALYTREMYSACANAVHGSAGWDTPMVIPKAVTEELAFWYAVRNHDGCAPFVDVEFVSTKTYFTDASDTSVGSFRHGTRALRHLICRRDLPDELVGTSSTLRELWGVLQCLRAFIKSGEITEGDKVSIGTDSQCAFYGVDRACSRTPANHALIKQIFEAAHDAGVEISVFWLPREENDAADAISKATDSRGYTLKNSALRRIAADHGHPQVDGFASAENAVCQAYVSRWLDADAESADTFRADWADGRRWHLFPPAGAIARCVRKAILKGGSLTIIIPNQPAASWFCMLFPQGRPISQIVSWQEVGGREIKRACASLACTRTARANNYLAIDFQSHKY